MICPLAIGRDWWLPTNYALHGREFDSLFAWYFWITLVVFVTVEAALVWFIWKFRSTGSAAKARFTHGIPWLELVWTITPALILAALALATARSWNRFRYSADYSDPARARILVIGQQFKWNVVYPGPDGKFGRYLQYPKPTDALWPVGADGIRPAFAGVAGPALLPLKKAVDAINNYIDSENPLGKDFTDPDGKDDDFGPAPGRPIFVPVDRPVEVLLESKDVIHDFYLPNFRVQLYAVPGMQSSFVFTPTVTTHSLELATGEFVSVDDLARMPLDNLRIDIDAQSPGAVHDKTGWRYVDSAAKKKPLTIIRDQAGIAEAVPAKLKAAGITRVAVHSPQSFEIACAQLCGAQHFTMRGELIVLPQAEFDARFPAAPHVK